MKTNMQMPQPMRSKRIVRNKTIIIINIFDKGQSLFL